MIFDRVPLLHRQHAPIDVFTCQFTGATMHPVCYEYDAATYRGISRRKRQAKFFGVRTAIEYQAAVMPPAAPPQQPADVASLRDGLIASLQRKLDVHAAFTDRLKMRSNVYFALDELPGYLEVDFSDCRVKQVSEIAEADHYLHRTSLALLRPVLAGEMGWEAYFLTFRFRNRRVPDAYDSAIIIFLFAEPDTYAFGLEQLIRHRAGGERIAVTPANGGGTYEINRFCPHQGGDLKYALIDGETLICPRHYWRFDLANGGKCTANEDTVRAVRIAGDE